MPNCPHCGKDFEALSRGPGARLPLVVGCLLSITGIGAIGYAAWINAKAFEAIYAKNARRPVAAAPVEASVAEPVEAAVAAPAFAANLADPFAQRPAVGEEGFIAMAGFPEVWVCVDEQSQQDWMRSMLASMTAAKSS